MMIEWLDRALTLTVDPGERVLDALDERPQTGTTFGCRGGTCGTCAVEVVHGAELVGPITDDERETLHACGQGANTRLLCQLRVVNADGSLQVRSAR